MDDELEIRLKRLERNQWFGVFASVIVSGAGAFATYAYLDKGGSCECKTTEPEKRARRRVPRYR